MRGHWESVYRTKQPEAVSWYQPRRGLSLDLIRDALKSSRGSVAAAAFENYFDQLRTAMRVALQDRR